MKHSFFLLLLLVCVTVISAKEKEHPTISFGGTELLQTENWIDDFVMDVRLFKSLNNGFAVGGKVALDFIDIVEAGVSFRKTIKSTLHAYGDGGYSFNHMDGGFGEIGIGTYFLRDNLLAISLGVKHYFGPGKTYMAIGFSINI